MHKSVDDNFFCMNVGALLAMPIGGSIMGNELLITKTINEVCSIAYNIVLSSKRYRMLRQADLDYLSEKIDEAMRIIKGNKYEMVFNNNLEIMKRASKRVKDESTDEDVRCFAIEQIAILRQKLLNLLEGIA